MHKLIIIIWLAPLAALLSGPLLTMPLSTAPRSPILTTFTLGTSQVQLQLDLNYDNITICCQYQQTLFEKVYYFMLTPFQQSHNYICQPKSQIAHGTATLPKIGPLSMKFNQSAYPSCHYGRLGFSKNAYFLSLLPHSSPFFIIEKKNSHSYILRVGGPLNSQYVHLPPINSSLWMASFSNLGFNGISLGRQDVAFASGKQQLKIPKKSYLLIKNQLVRNFLCREQNNVVYCPCTLGISSSFPSFLFQTPNTTFEVKPTAYLLQEDEICKLSVVPTVNPFWSVHILMLYNVDLLFDYRRGGVSIARHSKILQTNSIAQPLQIILNSAVILLMCLFVAMILIQLIKHLTGIQNASSQSFENYMMKRNQQ